MNKSEISLKIINKCPKRDDNKKYLILLDRFHNYDFDMELVYSSFVHNKKILFGNIKKIALLLNSHINVEYMNKKVNICKIIPKLTEYIYDKPNNINSIKLNGKFARKHNGIFTNKKLLFLFTSL